MKARDLPVTNTDRVVFQLAGENMVTFHGGDVPWQAGQRKPARLRIFGESADPP